MKKLDTETLNNLVGIKWVLDGRSREGADCVGLMELYFRDRGVEVTAPKINDLTPEGQEVFIRGIMDANMIVGLSDLQAEDGVDGLIPPVVEG